MIKAMGNFARGFGTDRRGAAAIEFAFIAPILLVLYFMTMEVSQAIETNKKVGRIASMVGDLVAQQRDVPREEVDRILDIGSAIIQPYGRSRPTIIVEHIQIEEGKANPKAFVEWSRKLEGVNKSQAVPKNTETLVPEQLRVAGTRLVRVTTQLGYKPVIAWTAEQKTALGLASAFSTLNMSEQYYLRPRMSDRVNCIGC
ncbi:pilus assembly protein [Mesorhizobium sp. YIM 152430]|uniref:TadE/TadG family type IV pilus assembly protein n=1 Tax=Mesorhizobium sp. YIM 152430 TaxID=3031761 RepID=UPI0023DA6BA2|nr:TadE/TadG family type IV pilus assembly protein [Mesorhizobium sp. YIM 152430]MDF1598817.1 pilus assembly protein [Mesorhizobium sp. YIM 152430]